MQNRMMPNMRPGPGYQYPQQQQAMFHQRHDRIHVNYASKHARLRTNTNNQQPNQPRLHPAARAHCQQQPVFH